MDQSIARALSLAEGLLSGRERARPAQDFSEV
jgi:hypothetical protein